MLKWNRTRLIRPASALIIFFFGYAFAQFGKQKPRRTHGQLRNLSKWTISPPVDRLEIRGLPKQFYLTVDHETFGLCSAGPFERDLKAKRVSVALSAKNLARWATILNQKFVRRPVTATALSRGTCPQKPVILYD